MPELIFLGITLVIVMLFISLGVKVVKEGEQFVIERLGVYNKILQPGVHFIIPSMERVKKVVSTKEQKITATSDFVTLDDEKVSLNLKLSFVVEDARLYTYALNNEESLQTLIKEKTKYEILKNNKQDLKLELLNIENKINESMIESLACYGILPLKISID